MKELFVGFDSFGAHLGDGTSWGEMFPCGVGGRGAGTVPGRALLSPHPLPIPSVSQQPAECAEPASGRADTGIFGVFRNSRGRFDIQLWLSEEQKRSSAFHTCTCINSLLFSEESL